MSILGKLTEGVRSRVERQVTNIVGPEGTHAKRVKQVASGYTLVVLLGGLLLLGMASGRGTPSILIILAMVLGVSKVAQEALLLPLYAAIAPKLGWPSMAEGWAQDKLELEAAAAQKAQGGPGARNILEALFRAPVKPSPLPAPMAAAPQVATPTSKVEMAVAAWAGLEPARRLVRAAEVADFIKADPEAPAPLRLLGADMPLDEKNRMANELLELMAKAKNYQLAS